MDQINIFDVMQSAYDVPDPNEEGMIPAELLTPISWDRWMYSNDNWTKNGGAPYIIEAVLAKLPGNRLYVKAWMLYPFMHEFSSSEKLEKAYIAERKKIEERIEHNNDTQRTWKTDEPPCLQDMWQYQKGEYSCKEYAKRTCVYIPAN